MLDFPRFPQSWEAIFATAEEAGILSRSPCRGVKLPPTDQRNPRFLSPEDLAILAEAHPKRYRALILFAGYSGLRFGEVVGLRLERVDFLRSRVTVTDTIVEVAGHLHRGPTKTGRGRLVTLPRFVTEQIAAHLSLYPSSPEELVFKAPEGGPIRRSAFRFRVFLPAIERAGLETLRIHDLRHTAAALAIRAGAHPKAIQERLGHASVATTLNVYGHLFPALDEELAARLDDVARTAAGPTRDHDELASQGQPQSGGETGP